MAACNIPAKILQLHLARGHNTMPFLVFVTKYAPGLAERFHLPPLSTEPMATQVYHIVNRDTTYAPVATWLVSRWHAMPPAVRATFDVDVNAFLAVHWSQLVPSAQRSELITLDKVWENIKTRNHLMTMVYMLDTRWRGGQTILLRRQPTTQELEEWWTFVYRMREQYIPV